MTVRRSTETVKAEKALVKAVMRRFREWTKLYGVNPDIGHFSKAQKAMVEACRALEKVNGK